MSQNDALAFKILSKFENSIYIEFSFEVLHKRSNSRFYFFNGLKETLGNFVSGATRNVYCKIFFGIYVLEIARARFACKICR